MTNKFLLGVSTAAHQVEGNNTNSDCWKLENVENSSWKEPSGEGVDHYNRYREDIDYIANNGLNAYRFTIEWARIQPDENTFSDEEFKHYEDVIDYCISKSVEPVVTLHHFSSPAWLITKGGWKAESTIEYFATYAKEVATRLGSKLKYVCTINELNMGLQMKKIMEQFMSSHGDIQIGLNIEELMKGMEAQKKKIAALFECEEVNSFLDPRTAEEEILVARVHEKASKVLKETCPHLKVGVTLSLYDYQLDEQAKDKVKAQEKIDKYWHEDFEIYFPYMQSDDFIGVQNYSRKIMNEEGVVTPENAILTDAGYEFYPQGISNLCRKLATIWDKELLITENGTSSTDDTRRVEFVNTAVDGIKKCVDDGINITGYMHWSLLDNFEWQLGYAQKYGLIEVDRTTMVRTIKPSFYELGKKATLFN